MRLYKQYRNSFTLAIVVLLSISCYAQKEANTWYFGKNAGLSFATGKPVALTNGKLNTFEGCATVSNADGKLLFYTDGVTVFDSNHDTLQNGFKLFGSSSSTQSSIVVAYPGDTSKYYIFTTDATENRTMYGFRYSLINMAANNGKGAVIEKNTLLFNSTTEKISATLHANKTDFWVLGHKLNNDEFLAYRVTKSGVQTTPVISKIGSVHKGGFSNRGGLGYLKISPNGKTVALILVTSSSETLEIFDFDTKTGKLSNARIGSTQSSSPYGVEFSPNSTKLYVTTTRGQSISDKGFLSQYDLEESDIFASRVLISESLDKHALGALQLGPDGKIYIANFDLDFLSVINNPDDKGVLCNFDDSSVSLQGKKCSLGLPSFNQVYFTPDSLTCNFKYTGACVNDIFTFYAETNDSLATYEWDFGDNTPLDTTSIDTASYEYNTKGSYNVKLTVKSGIKTCKIQNTVTVKDIPVLKLPKDTFVCENDSITITPLQYDGKILWNTAMVDTFPTLVVKGAGSYIATNSNECGTDEDTINITLKQVPNISITVDDSVVCINDTFNLKVIADSNLFNWQDGKTDLDRKETVKEETVFWVKSSNVCGDNYDSVIIRIYPELKIKIDADSLVCPDTDFALNAVTNADSITWFNTTKGNSIRIQIPSSQWVWLVAQNKCETKYDSLFVNTFEPLKINLGADKEICNSNVVLDAGVMNAEYVWQGISSFNSRTFTATRSGVYRVTVTRCNKSVTDSITVFPPQDTAVYVPNAFSPNRDLLNDSFVVFINGSPPQDYRLSIYDRWGGSVFKSNNYLKGWNGMLKDRDCPDGIYIYILELMQCNRVKRYKGNITLIR